MLESCVLPRAPEPSSPSMARSPTPVVRGPSRQASKLTTTTTTTGDDDDDGKQATTTTAVNAPVPPAGNRGGTVLLGSAQKHILIIESEALGVPQKEVVRARPPPWGEAYEPSPSAAQTRSESRAEGRRGRGQSPNGQQGRDHCDELVSDTLVKPGPEPVGSIASPMLLGLDPASTGTAGADAVCPPATGELRCRRLPFLC